MRSSRCGTRCCRAERPDGRRFRQTGVSLLQYAGNGRFSFEEDLLNMTHVLEDLAASGWRPRAGFVSPPANPDRDVTRPTSPPPT